MPQNTKIRNKIIEAIQACPQERIELFKLNRIFGKPDTASREVLDEMFLDETLLMYRNSAKHVVVAKKGEIYHRTKASAGADVPCTEAVTIKPGEQVYIKTNLCPLGLIAEDEVLILSPRSSFFSQSKGRSLILTNSIGIIDPDYPDCVLFSYFNVGREPVEIPEGEIIGQATVLKAVTSRFPTALVERNGGFGSTTKKQPVDQPTEPPAEVEVDKPESTDDTESE